MPRPEILNPLFASVTSLSGVGPKRVQLLFEHLDSLVAAHAAAKDIKLANALNGMPIPLHPGAEKYYKEKGLIK